jgi:HEPN domain-containing protein
MRGEALRWLSEARWDLETARFLHEAERFNAACFYAHQSAEKAAKALLYSVNEAPWGHSVRVLLERYFCRRGEEVEELLHHARVLDRHYIPSRYPNAHPSGTAYEAYSAMDSSEAIRMAERVLEYASGRLEAGG